jgi:hypothetical protein
LLLTFASPETSHLETLVDWETREDVFKDRMARMEHGYADTFFPSAKKRFIKSAPPVSDPIESEKLHGEFLSQVSSMWQYLAIAAADHGNLNEATRMLRRDLRDRSPSHWSGGILANYLICQGKFDEAWNAYREHLLCDAPFNAFELKQNWGLPYGSRALMDVVEGIDLSIEFKNFPEMLRHVDEWNEQATRVGGREFKTLGSMADTLLSSWFEQLDDLDKLRMLYYYRVTRPHDEKLEDYGRTGKIPDPETLVRQEEQFTTALHTSKDGGAIWARATVDHHLDPPL